MKYDQDKVDEMTLALLYLGATGPKMGFDARAWKGFDLAALHRLHEKGMIGGLNSTSSSINLTEEGFHKSEALFKEHFGKDDK